MKISAILRIQDRDDLLHLANEVAEVVGIVQEKETDQLGRHVRGESLLATALRRHLRNAEKTTKISMRSDSYANAAVILDFRELVGPKFNIPDDIDADRLYTTALEWAVTLSGSIDLWRRVRIVHWHARSHRLAERYNKALALADQPDDFYTGSSLEQNRSYYEYEWSATSMAGNLGERQLARLQDWVTDRTTLYQQIGAQWEREQHAKGLSADRTSHWSNCGQRLNRFEFACGLIDLASRPADTAAVTTTFGHARELADPTGQHSAADRETSGFTMQDVTSVVDGLSLTLAIAEVARLGHYTSSAPPRMLDELERAMRRLELSRLGLRVVARSRGPFSIALRRVLGDIAAMIVPYNGVRPGLLGLHIALLAKRAGLAAIIREQHNQLGPTIGRAVQEILRVEAELEKTPEITDEARARQRERILRANDTIDALSPILASWLFAQCVDPAQVVARVTPRYTLDFVALGSTATDAPEWFRTLVTPSGEVVFDHVPVTGRFAEFFSEPNPRVSALKAEWQAKVPGHDDTWYELGQTLLPPLLLTALAEQSRDDPIELLISPHGLLNSLPWQALRIARDGSRVVERAVVMHSPVLISITGEPLPSVTDPALVYLVSSGFEGGLDALSFPEQRKAWSLEVAEQPMTTQQCWLHAAIQPSVAERFHSAITRYGFVHVATHGTHTKLDQCIYIPHKFHTYKAMQARWPDSVLLAACGLGDDSTFIDEEPLGFAVATLAGGARCVVAGHGAVNNKETDLLAAEIVQALRYHPDYDLARALRHAQLALISKSDDDDYRIYAWGSFSAFIR